MISRSEFNDLKSEVIANRLGQGVGYRIKRTGAGTTLEIKPGSSPSTQYRPFHLISTFSDGEDPVPKIRVIPSTLAGGSSTDLGFSEGDDPYYLLTPSVGVLVGGITIDTSGNITSRWLEILASMPANTEDTFYVEIGTVWQDAEDNWKVTNSAYGPISANICRNWFASSAPYYGVTWIYPTNDWTGYY